VGASLSCHSGARRPVWRAKQQKCADELVIDTLCHWLGIAFDQEYHSQSRRVNISVQKITPNYRKRTMDSHEHSNAAHVHHPICCLRASSENACYLCGTPNAARSSKQTSYFADSHLHSSSSQSCSSLQACGGQSLLQP
jgi:hypothetical protein